MVTKSKITQFFMLRKFIRSLKYDIVSFDPRFNAEARKRRATEYQI